MAPMSDIPVKKGRPRRYDLPVPEGFDHRELALAVAFLQELAGRVYDQVEDLPREALDYVPANTTLSIGWLLVHLGWAEARWVGLATGTPMDTALGARLQEGALEHYGRPPGPAPEASALIQLCRRVQEEFTLPALRPVTEMDEPLERGGLEITLRGVMQQLSWHWTYHSGHIGLLRLLWGSDYQWTTESMRAPSPRR
jgi:uncharacterized damage-inducible protein DinB